MEQWPHLNELVQCYSTDWVKDENKYGHYETIGPASFQNQIYEGPDTDIETGNMLSPRSYSFILSLRKYLLLFTTLSLFRQEFCYSSQMAVDIESFSCWTTYVFLCV